MDNKHRFTDRLPPIFTGVALVTAVGIGSYALYAVVAPLLNILAEKGGSDVLSAIYIIMFWGTLLLYFLCAQKLLKRRYFTKKQRLCCIALTDVKLF